MTLVVHCSTTNNSSRPLLIPSWNPSLSSLWFRLDRDLSDVPSKHLSPTNFPQNFYSHSFCPRYHLSSDLPSTSTPHVLLVSNSSVCLFRLQFTKKQRPRISHYLRHYPVDRLLYSLLDHHLLEYRTIRGTWRWRSSVLGQLSGSSFQRRI